MSSLEVSEGADNDGEQQVGSTHRSRFTTAVVESDRDGGEDDGHKENKDDHKLGDNISTEGIFCNAEEEWTPRDRVDSSASRYLSRLNMVAATSVDAASLLGSSVLLSSPSYINIFSEVSRSQNLNSSIEATSMEYLNTILENAEYIDTMQGKLPLAEAARRIARDESQHQKLFNPDHVTKVKRECYRKLICIGVSLLCLFGSFFALRNLQSSISADNPTLGFVTFGCLRSLMWLGGLLANFVLNRIQAKWTMVVASVPFLLYPLANFLPTAFTLIPCALLAGCGMGMLWNAEGIYMINLAAKYAFVSRKSMTGVIGQFNGVVFTLYQCSHLIGNLLSSLFLSNKINWFRKPMLDSSFTRANNENTSTPSYSTSSGNETKLFAAPFNNCGIHFYSSDQVLSRADPHDVDQRQYYLLFGVLTGLAVIGFLNIFVLLKPLKTLRMPRNDNFLNSVKGFLKMFANPRILLLIPYFFYPGLSGSVLMADYTKAYVTCAYGISSIGYILIAGACFSIAGSCISGRLVSSGLGRRPVFIVATLVSVASLLMLPYWKPSVGDVEPLAFLPVCLWSFGDGIQMSQLNGFLGEMFQTDLMPALSVFHLCFGLGQILGAFTSAFNWITLTNKIIILMVQGWVSLILLVILDGLRNNKKL